MNTSSATKRLWIALLAAAFTTLGLSPLLAATTQTVAIDQTPPIIQKPLPPNIVLMLDDSTSMSWDYMPDDGYMLGSTSGNDNPETKHYRAYKINGVYYNPNIKYTPPPKATQGEGLFPSATFPYGWKDGFDPDNLTGSNKLVNITRHTGGFSYFTASVASIAPSCPGDLCGYPADTRNASSATCNWGYSYWQSDGYCHKSGSQNQRPNSYNCLVGYSKNTSTPPQCYRCSDGGTYNASSQTCVIASPSCPDGTIPSPSTGTPTSCNYNAFTFNSGSLGGDAYTNYHVATYCGSQSNCILSTEKDTTGKFAPPDVTVGENVSNWFSYYRTRMLMAKSGLMAAFYGLDSKYRFGFGSIDGSNVSDLSLSGDADSDVYSFTTKYSSTTYQTGISHVAAFGDGTTGTQKAQYWNWILGVTPSLNGRTQYTPLRGALKGVGEYYKTAQPWKTIPQADGADADEESSYACRQSYTILTTDGFWNGVTPSGIGNADGTAGDPGYQTPSLPFKDSKSDTLADVAMHYWKNDLQTGLENIVPTTTTDPANWQHMTTFTVGMGFDPIDSSSNIIDKKNVFAWAQGGTEISDFSWPSPSSGSIYNIADMMHAAVNGRGDFFSAKDPKSFSEGIETALNKIGSQVGAGASLTVSSSDVVDGYEFASTYQTKEWTGQLDAFAYDDECETWDAAGFCTTPVWRASALLPNTERNIWSWSSTNSALEFTDENVTALGLEANTVVNDVSYPTTTIVNYLRGDQSREIGNVIVEDGVIIPGTLRARASLLGDIVSSKPLYIKSPKNGLYAGKSFTGSDKYQTYFSNHKNDPAIVYVAANDGMLHAFNVEQNASLGDEVSAGQEIYAYLPGAVLRSTGDAAISNLAHPDYGAIDPVDGSQKVPHQYYHDGKMTVASAYFEGAWHRILVGTTGMGPANAIYALDITDPTKLADPEQAGDQLLWERSAGDGQSGSTYIGQMTGTPIIAQTANGSWSVLVGNGYNSAADSAALLQFDLRTGSLDVHTTGSAGAGGGLSAPGVYQANSNNGISTTAYAGDSKGNVYSFDLTASTSPGTLIFTSKPKTGSTVQPIIAQMLVTNDPLDKTVWVFFGTGKYTALTDKEVDDQQAWYGLRVQSPNTAEDSPIPIVTSTSTLSDLKERTIIAQEEPDSPVAGVSFNRATSLAEDGDMVGMQGWYMPLSSSPTATILKGERIVNTSQIGPDGLLQVTTLIPSSSGLCSTFPQGAFMRVDPATGANTGQPSLDTNGDGVVDQSDISDDGVIFNGLVLGVAPAGPPITIFKDGKAMQFFQNMDTSKITIGTPASSGIAGKVSWRELTN